MVRTVYVWICSWNNWSQNCQQCAACSSCWGSAESRMKEARFTAILNSFEVERIDAEDQRFCSLPLLHLHLTIISLHHTSNSPLTPLHLPPKTTSQSWGRPALSFWGSGDCLSWPPSTSRPQHSVLMKEAAQAECERGGAVSLDSIIWMLTPGSLPHRCGYLFVPR